MSQSNNSKPGWTRRDLLKGVAGAGLASALSPLTGSARGQEILARPDLIRTENEKPGTTDWRLTGSRLDSSGQRCPWIEGYCSRAGLQAGETLEIKVSTNPPSGFKIDLYRMGYYQGKGGRHMAELGPFKGKAQPVPPKGEGQLRECLWETTAKLEIPKDWPSGFYLGKLTEEKDKIQSYIVFVLRDDRPCDFLFQVSDMTWQAYNAWPSWYSLYQNEKKNGKKDNTWWGPETRVSFDRPYGPFQMHTRETLAGGQFLCFEHPMVFWMEKEGYDVSYISGVHTHADPKGLLRARAWLDAGHDEYWSLEAFNNLKGAIDQGVSAAFFAGNVSNGVLGIYPSSEGRPNRIISRIGIYGEKDPRNIQMGFPEVMDLPVVGPYESTLIGARNIFPWIGNSDWVCLDEKHWIHEGTGMKTGDRIPNLVGWEWHGDPAKIQGLEVVSKADIRSHVTQDKVEYAATVYPGPKGNTVFNASTIFWSGSLSHPPGWTPSRYGSQEQRVDPRVQRMTSNVLQRFRA